MKKLFFLFVSLFAVQVAMADEDPTIASFDPAFDKDFCGNSSSPVNASTYATDCAVEIKQFGHKNDGTTMMTLSDENFYKFNNSTLSSAYVKITLNSGNFQIGDIVHAEYTLSGDKSVTDFGLQFSGTTTVNNTKTITESVEPGSKEEMTYTLSTGDFSGGVLYIGRGGTNGAKIFVHRIWVTRSSSTKEDATTEFTNAYWGFALSAGTNAGQTVTTNSTGAVAYSSSNTDVVTVNEETGALTAVAIGKAVITANVAADDNYYASAADYTVYVLSAGTGTLANPYLPTDFRYLAEAGETASDKWVKGYIVGVWNSTEKDVKILPNSTTGTNNNIGLANTLSEKKGSSCLTVRLNSAPDIQQYINLKDNSDKYHQEVYVKGNIGSFNFSSNTVYGMPTPVEFRYGEESLDVTIGATGYATFSAMRGYVLPDGMDAYAVSSYSDGKVTLTKIAEKIVPAFTGVILKGASGTLTADETEVSLGSNSMKYNVKAKELTETDGDYTNFILVKDGETNNVLFGKVDGTSTLAANRAYLQLPTESLAGARELSITFDEGETTSISEELKVKSEEFAPAAAMYDLQGRRVAQPTKGLYFMNGKKYIVK